VTAVRTTGGHRRRRLAGHALTGRNAVSLDLIADWGLTVLGLDGGPR